MRFFAACRELANIVAMQRPHDADPGQHCWPASGRNKYQSFHRILPLRRRMLGLWRLGNVVAGVLELGVQN